MIVESRIDTNHLLLIGAGPGVGAAVVRRFGREGYRSTLVSRGEKLGPSPPISVARRRGTTSLPQRLSTCARPTTSMSWAALSRHRLRRR
jgi:hypothetical protein